MDTLRLLEKAATRAEELAVSDDPHEMFNNLGLTDDEMVNEFIRQQTYEIFCLRMITGGSVSIENVGMVSMMFGITVGYQLALLREENE